MSPGLAPFSIFNMDGNGVVGSIKLERMLRIRRDRVSIQNYFNELEKCSGQKKKTNKPKEITNRMNFGVMKYRIPEEGRDRKW